MKWEYKGHRCEIWKDYEEDNIKAFHFVVTPEGEKKWADITPYDESPETLHLWIEAGYPKRIGVGPLHREDLEKMIEDKALEEMFGD